MSMAGGKGMDCEDGAAARAAWGEFHRRHAEYLYAVCVRAYGALLGGEPGAADLVSETLLRAFEHASAFDPGDIEDPDRQRRRVRAWLGRIAERLAKTALRGRSHGPRQALDPREWEELPHGGTNPEGNGESIERVRAALAALTEKEQVVIRATFQWYRPGEPHQRLPNDVAADLAATLRTTPENLRQIRRRALKKVRAWLEAAEEAAEDAGGEGRGGSG
jgi:RNA polymerase sigma factor (sigma-70 family)